MEERQWSHEWRTLLAEHLQLPLSHDTDTTSVRRFVFAFVERARASGMASEQVIRSLKELTTPAMREFVATEHRARLADEIFQWCLDAYYGPSGESPRTDTAAFPPGIA